MAIIIKNNLESSVSYSTDPLMGSGTLQGNGNTISLNGSCTLYLAAGQTAIENMAVENNNEYILGITQKPL